MQRHVVPAIFLAIFLQSPVFAQSELDKFYARLGSLEQQAFGTTYSADPVADRIDRLEQKTFGHTQSGTPLRRLDALYLQSDLGAGASSTTSTNTSTSAGQAGSQTQQPVNVPFTPSNGSAVSGQSQSLSATVEAEQAADTSAQWQQWCRDFNANVSKVFLWRERDARAATRSWDGLQRLAPGAQMHRPLMGEWGWINQSLTFTGKVRVTKTGGNNYRVSILPMEQVSSGCVDFDRLCAYCCSDVAQPSPVRAYSKEPFPPDIAMPPFPSNYSDSDFSWVQTFTWNVGGSGFAWQYANQNMLSK